MAAHLFEDIFHVVGKDGGHGSAQEVRQKQHVTFHNGGLALPELRLLLLDNPFPINSSAHILR